MSIKIFTTEIHKDTMACEPLLIKGKNGQLICICQCEGPCEPHFDNREFIFRSNDNGKTWSGKERILPETGRAEYATGVSEIGDELLTFISTQTKGWYSPEDWKCSIAKSKDGGETWVNSEPFPQFTDYTFVRTSITLKSGTILIPYQTYPKGDDGNFHIAETGVLKSTDNGKTFTKHIANVWDLPKPNDHLWTEPTLAQLSNGTIVMLTRKDYSGWIWQCKSTDEGETWSETVKTDIANSGCKSKLLNLDNGKIALIHNSNSECKRYPLKLWISDDDMKTWGEQYIIAEPPYTYHYPDGFYENGHIKFVIERDRNTILYFDIEL